MLKGCKMHPTLQTLPTQLDHKVTDALLDLLEHLQQLEVTASIPKRSAVAPAEIAHDDE